MGKLGRGWNPEKGGSQEISLAAFVPSLVENGEELLEVEKPGIFWQDPFTLSNP